MSADGRVLASTAAVAALVVLTFGLGPALTVTRPDMLPGLGHTTLTASRTTSRRRPALLTAQFTASVVLLTTGFLLEQSWRQALDTDLGFDPDPVLAVPLDVRSTAYNEEERRAFYQALVQQLRDVPRVQSASVVEIPPVAGGDRPAFLFRPEQEDPPSSRRSEYQVSTNTIGPSYFATLGIPLLAGRDFNGSHDPDDPHVVIVNDTLARRYWPGASAIGQRVRWVSYSGQQEVMYERG